MIEDMLKFLGFANIYRGFIRNYSEVAAPLTSLLKAATKRNQLAECASEALKQASLPLQP